VAALQVTRDQNDTQADLTEPARRPACRPKPGFRPYLMQLVVMIAAARVMNLVFKRFGQPGVIGEIVAGLLLGPSLFGHFFPDVSVAVFGATASPVITVISQAGLTLLMFQIGCDFEFGHLRDRTNSKAVGWISLASISAPFVLGPWFAGYPERQWR